MVANMGLEEVRIGPAPLARLESLIGPDRTARLESAADEARELLGGHAVFNVNSTAKGGGVAELLQTLLANVNAFGIAARWLVIEGDAAFFTLTKRIHNHLYGTPGDGGPLGAAEHVTYEATTDRNVDGVLERVRPGDVVLLHDPQTAGLARPLLAAGIPVVWRCHVGLEREDEWSQSGWSFLRPYLEDVPHFVFSCEQFAPPWVPRDRLSVIPPSIDPFSAKNDDMSPHDVELTLQRVGLLSGGDGEDPAPFARRDGSFGRHTRSADLLGTGSPPPPEVPVVLQASRWDSLKDMSGVMTAFAEAVSMMGDAHLVLTGPSADGVADDPEAAAVLAECLSTWRSLPAATRERIHLASISMVDPDEASSTVNAMQRHATVVTQKSLAEGFGLTVMEAMWKSKPVVASAVGGIVDQIAPGETGHLVDDPRDLATFALRIAELLADPAEVERMGRNARTRVHREFLGDRHLEQWAEVLAGLA